MSAARELTILPPDQGMTQYATRPGPPSGSGTRDYLLDTPARHKGRQAILEAHVRHLTKGFEGGNPQHHLRLVKMARDCALKNKDHNPQGIETRVADRVRARLMNVHNRLLSPGDLFSFWLCQALKARGVDVPAELWPAAEKLPPDVRPQGAACAGSIQEVHPDVPALPAPVEAIVCRCGQPAAPDNFRCRSCAEESHQRFEEAEAALRLHLAPDTFKKLPFVHFVPVFEAMKSYAAQQPPNHEATP